MIDIDLLEPYLQSPEPMWELRGAIRLLLAQGHARDDLIQRLIEFNDALIARDRDDAIDTLNDVLAALTGYCPERMRLE